MESPARFSLVSPAGAIISHEVFLYFIPYGPFWPCKRLTARHSVVWMTSFSKVRMRKRPESNASRRVKHMGSFVFPLPCAARGKIPSRATQSDFAGAALAFRQRSAAQKNAAYESAPKPCFLCTFFWHSTFLTGCNGRPPQRPPVALLKR